MGLAFSDDSSMLFLIGADDKHVVTVFELREQVVQRLADAPGQVWKKLWKMYVLISILFLNKIHNRIEHHRRIQFIKFLSSKED